MPNLFWHLVKLLASFLISVLDKRDEKNLASQIQAAKALRPASKTVRKKERG
jgi:hypothetical protein